MKKKGIAQFQWLNSNEKLLIKQIFEDHEEKYYETKRIISEYINDYELIASAIEESYSAYEISVGKNYANTDQWLKLALIAIKEFYAADCPFPENMAKMSLFEFLDYCKEYVFQ